MKSRAVLSLIALMVCITVAAVEQSYADDGYDVEEAYEVYNVVLPHEESYGFSKGTLVIQQETVKKPEASGPCFTDEARDKFMDALSDLDGLTSKAWLLQRKFQIAKPYQLVPSDTIRLSLDKDGWDGFHKRYPSSGGYLVMSPVGFNKDKTRAIVYTGSSCGLLCGAWGFHLLEKSHGKWKQVPGITCRTVS